MMLRKTSSLMILIAAIFVLSGCEFVRTHTAKDFFTGNWKLVSKEKAIESYENNIPLLKQPSSVVVCRSKQCAPANLSMSKEYIFNSLLQLFDNNNYQKVLLCQADPLTHTCLENYLTLPVYVGIVPTHAYVDHAKITDVIVGRQGNSLNVILNYNVTYGGQVAECTPSQSLVFARKVNHVIIEDSGYNCKMTTVGLTNVKSVFAVDYIDLDYGYIGGYYSIGLSGPAYGGGNGYMLFRLPKNAYPLSPRLMTPKNQQPTGMAASVANYSSEQSSSSAYNNSVQVFPIAKKTEDITE